MGYTQTYFLGKQTNIDCVILQSLSTTMGKLLEWDNICGMAGLGTMSDVIDADKVKTLCSKYSSNKCWHCSRLTDGVVAVFILKTTPSAGGCLQYLFTYLLMN